MRQFILQIGLITSVFISTIPGQAQEYLPPDEKIDHTHEALKHKRPRTITEHLENLGYYNIDIEDESPDYEIEACRDGREYELKLDHNWRLLDLDDEGRCDYDKHQSGVSIDVPFASVDVDKDINIRAPFVDLRIRRDGY